MCLSMLRINQQDINPVCALASPLTQTEDAVVPHDERHSWHISDHTSKVKVSPSPSWRKASRKLSSAGIPSKVHIRPPQMRVPPVQIREATIHQTRLQLKGALRLRSQTLIPWPAAVKRISEARLLLGPGLKLLQHRLLLHPSLQLASPRPAVAVPML